MASITIRNLDEGVKKRLRRQAADNGRSLEAEVREILSRNASSPAPSCATTGLDLFRDIRAVVEKFGEIDLEIPTRTPIRGLEKPAASGPDGRHRDKNGTITRNSGSTRVATLRETYGDEFASGVGGDKKLGDLPHSKSGKATSRSAERRFQRKK